MYFLKELTQKEDAKLMQQFEQDKTSIAHACTFPYFTDIALVTTGSKGFMQLVNIKTGVFQTYLTHFDGGHIPRTGPLRFAVLSPALYVAHSECHHVLFCLGTSNELLCGNFHTGQVAVVGEFSSRPSCIFADGEYAACGTSDGTIHVWRATTLLYDGYDLRYAPHPGDESIQKSFSFAGDRHNLSGASGAEAVLKVNDSGSILWRRKAHRSAISTIHIERDFMVVACADFTVAVHSLHGSGEQLASFQYDSYPTLGFVPLGPSAHRLAAGFGPKSAAGGRSAGIDFGAVNRYGELRLYGASPVGAAEQQHRREGAVTDGVVGRVDHSVNPGADWDVLGPAIQLVEVKLPDSTSPQLLTPTCVATCNGFLLVGTSEGYVAVYSVSTASSSSTQPYSVAELCMLNIGAADGDGIVEVTVLADDHLVVITHRGTVWRWPMGEVVQQASPQTRAMEEGNLSAVRRGDVSASRQHDEESVCEDEEDVAPEARSSVQTPTPQDNRSGAFGHMTSGDHSRTDPDENGSSFAFDDRHESVALRSHLEAPFRFDDDDQIHQHAIEEYDDPVEVVEVAEGDSDYSGGEEGSVGAPSTLHGANKRAASSVGITFSESPSSIAKGQPPQRGGGSRHVAHMNQSTRQEDAAASNLGSDVRALETALRGRGGKGTTSPRSRLAAAAQYDPQMYAPDENASSSSPRPHMFRVAVPVVAGLKEGRRADPRKVAALVNQLRDQADIATPNGGRDLFVPTTTTEDAALEEGASSQVSPRDVAAYKQAHQLEVAAMRARLTQQALHRSRERGGRSPATGFKRGDSYFADPALRSTLDLSHVDDISGGGLLLGPAGDHAMASPLPVDSRRRPVSPSPSRLAPRSSSQRGDMIVVGSSPIGPGAGRHAVVGASSPSSSIDSAMMGSDADGEGRFSPVRPQQHPHNRHPPTILSSGSPPRVKAPSPTAIKSDDLVDVTFLQYARKVDSEYERKRTMPGPNINAHLCDAQLFPHLAPTHLSPVNALDDSPTAAAPPRTSLLPDVTNTINVIRNRPSERAAIADKKGRPQQQAAAPAAAGPAAGGAKYVPDIVFFYEPEMRWSASSLMGGGAPAPRVGRAAILTSAESASLFGNDPFTDSALPVAELPLGVLL